MTEIPGALWFAVGVLTGVVLHAFAVALTKLSPP